jgi:nucleoside-diphosphate-sugar epimerase
MRGDPPAAGLSPTVPRCDEGTRRVSLVDLDHIMAHTAGLWDELSGQRLFITGGTGFFGMWLLESFTYAVDTLGLGASAVVLTRDAAAFRRKAPHLASHPALTFHAGDVRTVEFPRATFSHIIHAATETNTKLDNPDPLCMCDASVLGTRRVLEFAVSNGTRKFLLTSSGAVYGQQPPEMVHVTEDYMGAPSPVDTHSAYGHGKRMAEFLSAAFAEMYGLEAKIARGFAFVGPHLPLNSGFAIGNFIRDALRGGPVCVKGDGTSYRSFLYAADLAIWLWTILFRGQAARPYNVGSDVSLTIAELARTVVTELAPRARVENGLLPVPGKPPQRYVPAIDRARSELGLGVWVSLEDAIQRTAAWYTLKVDRR